MGASRTGYLHHIRKMDEDEQILKKLDEVIQKKKDEIAGLNRLLGFIDQSSMNESDSKEKTENNEPTDRSNIQ